MLKRSVVWLLLFLAGCTAVPQPFESPQPYSSPLAVPMAVAGKRIYLPLLTMTPFISSKKGVAGGPCSVVEHVGATWYYGWSASGPDCHVAQPTRYESGHAWFVPMIWGPEKLISAASLGTGARLRIVMGPNEPDRPDQANLTVAETVSLVRWMELRYDPAGWQIIAPAMSHRTLYLEQVYAEYIRQYAKPPRWQALAIHCYRPTAADCISDISYYIDLAHRWHIPGGVWLTEFSFHPCWMGTGLASMLDALREAETLVRWLETTPEITAYAWFVSQARDDEPWLIWTGPGCGTRLYDPIAKHYTTFGKWYRGAPWPEPEFQAFLAQVARDGYVQ